MKVSLDVTAVPARPAGAGRYVVELAGQLARSPDVDMVYIARKNDAARWDALDVTSRTRAVAPALRPLRLAWEQLALPGELHRSAVEVHHAPHYTMPERARVPTVVTIHDMTFFDNPEWHERSKVALFRRAIRVAVERADHLIAVSGDTARRIRERFGEVDISVIPHGIDHERFHPRASADESRMLGDIGIPERYIGFVGTIEPRKNLPHLIQAFDRIAGDYPDLHLVIAGQRGWGLDSFESALASSRHTDRIVITGYLPEQAVPALLRQASVVAYPSLAEGFGLPALEALACGAPLVSTTGSAVEEVVGGTAMLVPPGDVNALASALDRTIREPDQQRISTGLAIAGRFTWAASAAAHIDVYRKVRKR